MKIKLFPLLCFVGLLPISVSILRSVPHRYDLMMTPETWFDGRSYCRVTYTDAATILSDTDWLRVQKVTTSKGLTTNAWAGVYNDVYNWPWVLNEIPLAWSNWIPGQPDNYNRNQMCAIIAGYNQWDDVPCDLLRAFICYDARYSGASRFIGISSPHMTWPDARTYCQTHHTDLASCFNSADNDLLVAIKAIQSDSWIGLYRDMDMWKWSDGTYAPNIPWYPGQPDNYFGSEDCAVVYKGQFYDEQCRNLHYIFCHTLSPMRSQILRLQVKADESVFDPAVQSYILEQIKEKVKEKAMLTFTTLTWKMQPDGNIFHKKNK